jgi:ATP-dependent DNA helicase RecQ
MYEFLYRGFANGEGSNHQILKTQSAMAREAGLASDQQAGTILKMFEKYGIVTTGTDSAEAEDFRGKGVTLLMPKTESDKIPVDWKRQELLENESYFKLEQVKKMLFSPNCRKRFILEYFGDTEDLETLGENCGACDYCIDRRKFASGNCVKLVQLSVFERVLDAVARFDQKFGVNLFATFLTGGSDQKIQDRRMDSDENFGVLGTYSTLLVVAVIESLIRKGYLEKTEGMYPLLAITQKGKSSLRREQIMKEEETDLQSYVALKARDKVFKKSKKEPKRNKESL